MGEKPGLGSHEAFDSVDSDERWMASLSYLFALSLIPYLLWRDSDFVRFHSRQGVLLFLLELLGLLVLWLLDCTVGRIPFLGLIILILARLTLALPLLGLIVLGFTRSLAGECSALPWIGRFAESLPDPPFMKARRGA